MLSNLSIRNYAIIKELSIEFAPGFCVVTGETGAGKSIIMGAMSLILGQRADTSVLNDKENKCVVEGRFILSPTDDLKSFFEENDLDYEKNIILRREITNTGKTRAFVNDTPVQLTILRDLGLKLIDIHSQHSNLELGKHQFQLNVIDWYGNHSNLLETYSTCFGEWRRLVQKQQTLKEKATQSKADLDYFEFQFKQLDEAKLIEGELEDLEQQHEMLTHSEEIKTGLNLAFQRIDGGEINAIANIKEAKSAINKLAHYLPEAKVLHERLESQLIEMLDIAAECELLAEKTEHDPVKLEEITTRLNYIYTLLQKHRVETVASLIALRNDFDAKIQTAASFDEELIQLGLLIEVEKGKMVIASDHLHQSRFNLLPVIEKEITAILQQLGMPNALFKIELRQKEEFTSTGNDEVFFLFNANKGGQLDEINKVASGGELSRLMLAIKTVVAKSKALPAIIFDEIDTGISGEIAAKMGEILKTMSRYMQVINITHLPQIAAKGESHYFVYKNETSERVETGMRLLTPDERVTEIAKMLSGEKPSIAAIENAKSLLQPQN